MYAALQCDLAGNACSVCANRQRRSSRLHRKLQCKAAVGRRCDALNPYLCTTPVRCTTTGVCVLLVQQCHGGGGTI